MTNCIYILLCSNDRYYVGSASDLLNRLGQHHSGKVKATKNIRPLKLIFFQSYSTVQEARKMEYWLKKQKDKNLVQRIISEGFILKKL